MFRFSHVHAQNYLYLCVGIRNRYICQWDCQTLIQQTSLGWRGNIRLKICNSYE